MRKLLVFIFFVLNFIAAFAVDLVAHIYDAELPVLINKKDNILCEIMIESELGGERMDELCFTQQGLSGASVIASRLFYSGTSSVLRSRTPSQAIDAGVQASGGSQSFYCHPSYSIKKGELRSIHLENVFPVQTILIKGPNYFWISLQLDPTISLDSQFRIAVKRVKIDGREIALFPLKEKGVTHRVGVALRQAGDDGVCAYRIPGLATTSKGTLLAVYDARHQTNIDLQEDIDVGLSRSRDGGQSWEPMRIVMDMGEYNGLPQGQNGIGDPAILVDEKTNRIWVSAVWVHGLANARAWGNVRTGMVPEDGTGQLMLVNSGDDGKTWSKPINITSQVKCEDVTMLLQGPGRGTMMKDGTLLFPVQYKSVLREGRGEISIIYSKDRGATWQKGSSIPTDEMLSEPQVVEITPGVLMVNARTSAPYRFVAISKDLGKSWEQHPSSGRTLVEPGCMASLLQVPKEVNILQKDVLLFSNPHFPAMRPAMSGRRNITIKASLDGGCQWPEKYQINLDEEQGWGYSCLTMIDKETIGILYEGSTAQMVFQRIKLSDLLKE